MRRGPALLLLVGALGLPFLAPEAISGQIGLEEVKRLNFQGNQRFSDEELAAAIITRETECKSIIFQIVPFCLAGADFSLDPFYLNPRELRRDHARVRLFYYLRGYREAVVDTLVVRPAEDEVRITFRIQEGEPILVTELQLRFMEETPDSSGLDDLPLKVGEPLSMVALDATRDTLERRFRNRGFAHAEVFRNVQIFREPHEAEVALEIFPGPPTRFGPITVDIFPAPGRAASMEVPVVLRMLPFEEGDVYREDLRFEGQRALYNLDIFRNLDFKVDSASAAAADSILPFSIRLDEDNIHTVRTGAGLNTGECFNFEAGWTSRNFMGGARRLQITGRVSNVLSGFGGNTILCDPASEGYRDPTGLVSVDFNQPWFYSPRNSISAGVFFERQSIPDAFIREARGINLGFNRRIGASAGVGLSFRPRRTKFETAGVFFCSAYLVCSPGGIDALSKDEWLSPVGIAVSRDRRNQILNPTRGSSALLDLEYAGAWTGSKFRYRRILSELTWHTEGRSGWVLGARVRGGWVTPTGSRSLGEGENPTDIVHPEKRLFAGGSNSVRGFAQNRLGPQVLYLKNVEDMLEGCAPEAIADLSCDPSVVPAGEFYASPTGGTKLFEGSLELRFPLGGPLWEGATFLDFGQVWDEDTTPDPRALDYTPGFGIRFFSPIGPIRIDVAYRFGGDSRWPVVTQEVVPFDPAIHEDADRLANLDWAKSGDLTFLANRMAWDDARGSSILRRFQFHFSIGQAF